MAITFLTLAGSVFDALRRLVLHGSRRSPIPLLPGELSDLIGRMDVTVPEPRRMAPGGLDAQSLVWLTALAQTINARAILEIGTASGLTALTLAVNLPAATIYTLDLPEDSTTSLPVGAH